MPLGLICETHAQLDFWRPLPADYVFPHYKLVRPQLIREIQQTGGQVFVWTVNNPADMRRFVEWGVDGILSDDTELLVRTLRPEVGTPGEKGALISD
jgi:glycerophosphoryl diester phosphodiesterase